MTEGPHRPTDGNHAELGLWVRWEENVHTGPGDRLSATWVACRLDPVDATVTLCGRMVEPWRTTPQPDEPVEPYVCGDCRSFAGP